MHQHHIYKSMHALWNALSTNKFLNFIRAYFLLCEIYFPDCCMIARIISSFANTQTHTHILRFQINKTGMEEKYGDRKFFFLNLLLIKCLNRFLRHGWPLIFTFLPVSHALARISLSHSTIFSSFICLFVERLFVQFFSFSLCLSRFNISFALKTESLLKHDEK